LQVEASAVQPEAIEHAPGAVRRVELDLLDQCCQRRPPLLDRGAIFDDPTMQDDDEFGACCAEMILFTRAWNIEYAPGQRVERFAVVALLVREDEVDQEPFGVETLDRVAELIEELNPPRVTIRSAPGENVSRLQGLVERATAAATRTVH